MKRPLAALAGLLFALATIGSWQSACLAAEDSEQKLPNVVFILTDNHGAWTLGCYGNPDIATPNIDHLSQEGMRFTRAFSVNAVCSPTRATFLTGLIPSQHGVHCFLGGGNAQTGPHAYCTIREFRTLPKILAAAGYQCGMIGKWHLGANMQPQEGFRDWITMPLGSTATFYDARIIEDGQIRREPQYLTEFWTDHAVEFLRKNKDRRFFLYLPYNGPYGLGGSLLKPTRNRHAETYADAPLESFPRTAPHPWLYNNRRYLNNPHAIRRYAAEISGVDDGVGRVLQTLDELQLDENTLVVFTADQGHAGGQQGIWGMGDHTRPLHGFDPTTHIPMIWRWPGHIPAGETCDLMVSNYDFLPTVLSLIGLGPQMPEQPLSPGRDFSPALRGESIEWDNVIFYEFENLRMIRTEDWKLVRRFPKGPDELYHLAADPDESHNLVGLPQHAEKETELDQRLGAFFEKYADPKYDLWHGGRSKSLLLTMPERRIPAAEMAKSSGK